MMGGRRAPGLSTLLLAPLAITPRSRACALSAAGPRWLWSRWRLAPTLTVAAVACDDGRIRCAACICVGEKGQGGTATHRCTASAPLSWQFLPALSHRRRRRQHCKCGYHRNPQRALSRLPQPTCRAAGINAIMAIACYSGHCSSCRNPPAVPQGSTPLWPSRVTAATTRRTRS